MAECYSMAKWCVFSHSFQSEFGIGFACCLHARYAAGHFGGVCLDHCLVLAHLRSHESSSRQEDMIMPSHMSPHVVHLLTQKTFCVYAGVHMSQNAERCPR